MCYNDDKSKLNAALQQNFVYFEARKCKTTKLKVIKNAL